MEKTENKSEENMLNHVRRLDFHRGGKLLLRDVANCFRMDLGLVRGAFFSLPFPTLSSYRVRVPNTYGLLRFTGFRAHALQCDNSTVPYYTESVALTTADRREAFYFIAYRFAKVLRNP